MAQGPWRPVEGRRLGLLAGVAAAIAAAGPAAAAQPDGSAPAAGGERIAFARHCGTGCADIFSVRPDGSGLVRLTRGRDSFDPAFSSDGRRLVFASERGGRVGAPELHAMNADGTGLRRLTRTAGGHDVLGDDGTPSYSPDGARIAFTSNGGRNNEIYVMDADGSDRRRLTAAPARTTSCPASRPTGRGSPSSRRGAAGRTG